MPRWRRVAGMLSMPPVAHPRHAAKPSAVTTVGAGLVPTHSHPKNGLHPVRRAIANLTIFGQVRSFHWHHSRIWRLSGETSPVYSLCTPGSSGKPAAITKFAIALTRSGPTLDAKFQTDYHIRITDHLSSTKIRSACRAGTQNLNAGHRPYRYVLHNGPQRRQGQRQSPTRLLPNGRKSQGFR